MGLSFTIAAFLRQRSHSWVRVPHFTVSDSRLTPNWKARSPYLYSEWKGCPSYIRRNWVPYSSPPTSGRMTVEVFESVSTRDYGLRFSHWFFWRVISSGTERRVVRWKSTDVSEEHPKKVSSRDLLAHFFTLVSFLAYSSSLKTEKKYSFKTSVDIQLTTRSYKSENRTLQAN
jgi:hypothetical protein